MRLNIGMTKEELRRCHVIGRVLEGVYTVREAADLLSLSDRHVKRLKRRYLMNGEAGLIKILGYPRVAPTGIVMIIILQIC